MKTMKRKALRPLISAGATVIAAVTTTAAQAGTYCEWGWYAPIFWHDGATCDDTDNDDNSGHGITYSMGVYSGSGPSQINTTNVNSGTGWWLRTDVDCNNSGENDGPFVQANSPYFSNANWCLPGDDMIMGEGYVYVY